LKKLLVFISILSVKFISAQNIGIGTATPTEKLDVNGNLKLNGALVTNNTAGVVGQVLTSNGPNNTPTWNTGISAGNKFFIRYGNVTEQQSQAGNNFNKAVGAPSSQSAYLDLLTPDYNTNADVTIDITNDKVIFNRSGLYHLEGMCRFFLNCPVAQEQNLGLSANVNLELNDISIPYIVNQMILQPNGSISGIISQYAASIPFEINRYYQAGTSLKVEVNIVSIQNNTSALTNLGVSSGGYFSGYFISE
jgi:hypothetical protein